MVDADIQKRINRNNRKRGGQFEKRCADFLDMDIVPYSGSNGRFGYGDVRDSVWLGECKNITPDYKGRITIKHEWIEKNLERASGCGRTSFLAFMRTGSSDRYVVVKRDVIDRIDKYLRENQGWDNSIVTHSFLLPNNPAKSVKNHILFPSKLTVLRPKYGCARVTINEAWDDYPGQNTIYIMRIECFKILINMCEMKGQRSGDQCQA